MLSRLETMVLAAAPLPLEAVRQQIASAVDIIVHLSRMRDKSRRVLEITEVAGCCNGQIRLNPLFIFEEEGEVLEGKVSGSLKRTANDMIFKQKFRMAGISRAF
jgi:pilus assembly protein CpaF